MIVDSLTCSRSATSLLLPPSATSNLTFSDDASNSNGRSRLAATTIETIDFTNPNQSLKINAGTGTDTLG